MSETQKSHIEPGIYKHFKGNLYFVLALAWSRNDPTNPEKAEVTYHPLYQVENLGWRNDISLKEFLENVDRPELNYSGPRFVKIMDWKLPNILPGCKFTANYVGADGLRKFVITRCYYGRNNWDQNVVMIEAVYDPELKRQDKPDDIALGSIVYHYNIQ